MEYLQPSNDTIEDRQPCWYVNFDNEEKKWIAGVKGINDAQEIEILCSNIGNIDNQEFLSFITSIDTAIFILNQYRQKRSIDIDELKARIK